MKYRHDLNVAVSYTVSISYAEQEIQFLSIDEGVSPK